MKNSKLYGKVLGVGALLAIVVSCQCKKDGGVCPRKKAEQVIRISIENEPQTLDPRKTRSLGDMNLIRNFWEGLVRTDKTGLVQPAIAEKYTISNDNKTYQFNLKETNWSNGDPLTAHDFVYAWKKTISPDFLSDYAFLLYSIKNAKAIKEGQLPMSMLGVRAADDYTLVVELESATPYFLELVALPVFFPVNQRVDKQNPDWFRNSNTYVSNGPFQMAKWNHNDLIVATKNLGYWDRDVVNLDRIDMVMVDSETSYLMFENDELDWQGSPYSSVPTDALERLKGENKVFISPFLGTYWIRTNTSLYPFHSSEIRKALALSINRNEIVEHVTCGDQTPATGIVPASMGLQSTPYFVDGDVEQAMNVFQCALEKENMNIENFPELTLTYTATARHHKIAQAIQDQWRNSLGIVVKLEPLEKKVYLDRLSKGDYQMACGDWIADFRDPVSFLEIFKAKSFGSNNTSWESLDYQKALESSYLVQDGQERLETLRDSEQIIMDEMPVIPIFHHSMVHLKNDCLKDVVLNDTGHIDFKWAYVVN